jgi:hypothetical protein
MVMLARRNECSPRWPSPAARRPDIQFISEAVRAGRTAAGRDLALGAPVVPGGNVGPDGRRGRNVGEPGAPRANWRLRLNRTMAVFSRVLGPGWAPARRDGPVPPGWGSGASTYLLRDRPPGQLRFLLAGLVI